MSDETKRFARLMGIYVAWPLAVAAIGAAVLYGILTGWR